jgi:hypothetical protein
MKATKEGSYKKVGTGNDVYRYIVSGTDAELAAFKAAQGDMFRETENGQPIWFTTNVYPNVVELGISQKSGKVFPNTAELDAMKNLVKQNKGLVAEALAKLVAEKLLASIGRTSAATAVNTPAEVKSEGLEA